MYLRNAFTALAIIYCTSYLAGCGSTPEHSSAVHTNILTTPAKVNIDSDNTLAQRLHQEYRNWYGVPYRIGGLSKRGIDCSGFVHVAFKNALGLSVPRSTETLVQSGTPVSRDDLAVGDLVFFKTGFKQRHVGIYIGNQRFIHASTSKGVMKSSLNSRYWDDSYWTSRRLIYY